MTPETIMQTIKSVADATAEIFKYLQTPAGQKAMEKMLADQEAAARNFKAIGDWFEKLFTGKLL